MKAATYARYSTENQSDASIEDQQRECARIALSQNLTVVATFADHGISGGTTERAGYQAMLAAARRGEFEVLVAEDISRIWRNMAEQAPRLAELADLGVAVITHDLDTRADSGELLGAVQGAMNSLYRKEISRRTRRGLEGRALAGQSTGGICYGYRGTAIDHRAAEVVRRIFAARVEGASCATIARQLNAAGTPAPRGGRWNPSTIHALLANRRYAGAVVYGTMTCHRSAVDSRHQRRLVRPGGPLVARQDEDRRIISEELWTAAQHL